MSPFDCNKLPVPLSDPLTVTSYQSLLLWQTVSPFDCNKLPVPFTLINCLSLYSANMSVPLTVTNYQSLLLWQTVSTFDCNKLPVPFTLINCLSLYSANMSVPLTVTNYRSLLLCQTVPFTLTSCQTVWLWQATSPFHFSDVFIVKLQLTGNKSHVDWKLQHLMNDQSSLMIPYIISGMWLI